MNLVENCQFVFQDSFYQKINGIWSDLPPTNKDKTRGYQWVILDLKSHSASNNRRAKQNSICNKMFSSKSRTTLYEARIISGKIIISTLKSCSWKLASVLSCSLFPIVWKRLWSRQFDNKHLFEELVLGWKVSSKRDYLQMTKRLFEFFAEFITATD